MRDYMYLLPEETVESNIESVSTLRTIEEMLRGAFIKEEYNEVVLPSFVYTQLYTKLDKKIRPEELFQFINHEGKSISMRYDFTIPLARMYALTKGNEQAKYCYFGKVFRKVKKHKGRSSEIYQGGIELINQLGLPGDKACLTLLQETINLIKLDDVIIEVGSAPFYNRLLELVEYKDELQRILKYRDCSAMKQYVETNHIEGDLKQLLVQLPTAFGGLEVIDQCLSLNIDQQLIDALTYLKEVYVSLDQKQNMIFDLAMDCGMEYYTGIMFKGYTKNSAVCIINGGRYDNLLPAFGKQAGAIGFCFNLDQVVQAKMKGEA